VIIIIVLFGHQRI